MTNILSEKFIRLSNPLPCGRRSRPRLREREGPAASAVGGIGPKARTGPQGIGLPGIELFLPVVVGVHVREDQNPELLSKEQDTLNVKKIGGRKPYHVLFYSLPMILAIGYKVKGTRGVQFEK